MNLIKKTGTLGIWCPTVLFVLIGLLVSVAPSQAADNPTEDASFLKMRLNLLKNSYRQLCKQFSNLAPNCSAPVINCTECPEKWLRVGDHCFFLSADSGNWSYSAKKCEEIGGHLAILTNREQHDTLEEERRGLRRLNTHHWIGLTDTKSDGNWTWVDSSAPTHGYWGSKPENNKSDGEKGKDCVVVDTQMQSWHDVPCSYEYPRVCQMDATPLV